MTSHPNRPQASPTVQVENARTIITQWRFAPEAETGWHRHGMDYIVVPMTTGKLLLEEPGGGSRSVLVPAGTAYQRSEGVEHNVVNGGVAPMSFVEVELK